MSNEKKYKVGIVGATGLVGQELITLLTEREFPIENVRLAASKNSIGEDFQCMGKTYQVEILSTDFFENLDLCFFCASPKISEEYAAIALDRGCFVIDKNVIDGQEYRSVVVPEVNIEDLHSMSSKYVRNPSSITIPLALVLSLLAPVYRPKRVFASSYQSVSAEGQRGIEELTSQVGAMFSYQETQSKVFPQRIAFNLIPNVGGLGPEGFSYEEKRVEEELQQVLHRPDLHSHFHLTYVPTFIGSGISLSVECERAIDVEEVRALLCDSKTVKVIDSPGKGAYPVLLDVQGQDEVFVGRIRTKTEDPKVLDLWIVNDNLKRGGALNFVQLAENFISKG
ncbi:MAG: aspartate-semialdehyde dehydrogenase [Bdellovibrionales bacterium]|nr:aspartate-semialdehyde dehydrogenase [Bdellovibrionales bacterium]